MVTMKNALVKDTLREIRHTLSRFLSIFLIVALGVAFFAGVKATCPDMKLTADRYFDGYNLMDIRLLSTIGFTDEDVKEIRKVSGIKGVMPAYSTDALVKVQSKDLVIKVMSLPIDKLANPDEGYINRVKLVSGRYPQKPDECVAEKGKIVYSGMAIGSRIKLSSGTKNDISNRLKFNEYTIVGIVETPYYISYERGTSSIGSGKINSFIMIPEKDFNIPAYTDIFVTVNGAREKPCYDDSYDDVIKPVKDSLENLGKTRVKLKHNQLQQWARDDLDLQKRELESSEVNQTVSLNAAASKLEDSKAQIEYGQSSLKYSQYLFSEKIKSTEAVINEGRRKLSEGEAEYEEALNSFNEQKIKAQKELITAQNSIDEADRKIRSSEDELDSLKMSQETGSNLSDIEKSKLQSSIDILEQQTMFGKIQLDSAKAALSSKRDVLNAAEKKLQDAKAQLDESRSKLIYQEEALKSAKEKGANDISAAWSTLNDSAYELEKGIREYENGSQLFNTKIPEAKGKIAEAKHKIDDIKEPVWYILDRDTNPGFVDYGNAADRMDAIAAVFPVFFFLVAALVCLTTMTRMVDEQRGNIGTLKALGYSKASIASKYLLYAAFASVGGSIFGLLLGFKIFPTVIFNSYGILYTMPPVVIEFNSEYAAISIACAVLSTTLAALFACYNEFTMTPALLMRPKAPKAGKRVILEKITFIWSRLNFTQKITARNLLRYKKRFFMTVLGIGGCTALLLAGFGLKDSIMSIVTKQFDELYRYDMVVEMKKEAAIEDSSDIINVMNRDNSISGKMLVRQQNVDISSGDVTKSVTLFVPENAKKLGNFIILRVRTTGKDIPLNDDGVVLSEKLAKMLGAGIGDKVHIKDDDSGSIEVKVTGITENYVSHFIYMSPALYNSVYGKKVMFKQILAKTIDTSESFENSLSTDLLKNSDVSSVSFTTGISSNFKDIIGSLNYIVLVLIVSAGALAFVVLYNLTNINVTERLREIATIKVLGFYDNEVSSYVYRENIFLTLIGIILGLTLGIFLHRFIVVTAEVEYVMFGRDIHGLSFVYSALLTTTFSGMVNLVMYFRLKKINMVESMKSVD